MLSRNHHETLSPGTPLYKYFNVNKAAYTESCANVMNWQRQQNVQSTVVLHLI